MTRSIIRYGIPFVGGTIVSLAAFACSSDSPAKNDKDDAGAGGAATGGASNTGGRQTGGVSSTGGRGTGGAAGAPDLYECEKRPARDPGGTGIADSECCDVAGVKYGTCTAEASITDPIQREAFGYDTCSKTANLKCAPTPAALADAGTLGVFETCTWTVGSRALEGRCLPECFIAGNPAASQLTQGTCAVNLLCAPCYNPIDGSTTGACEFKAGDAPANPAPTPFAECGANDGGPPGGKCVPLSLAVASGNPAAGSLPQLSCPANEICAPTLKVGDLNACFAHCTSAASIAGPNYAVGGCVPYYLVAAVAPTGLAILTQDTCATGELCAPCLNPLPSGDAGTIDTRTGACD